MFAQSVQEDCLLVLHIRTPCTPGLFLLFLLFAGVHSFYKDASLALSIKPHWSPHTPTSRLMENTGLKLAHAHKVFTRRLHNSGA